MRPSPLQLADESEALTLERRSSQRQLTDGPIILSLIGRRESIAGQLRDLSDNGFRAIHPGLAVSSGDRVEFSAGAFHGTALVVWTRSSAAERESGFLIIR
jgi:hypothetical protein